MDTYNPESRSDILKLINNTPIFSGVGLPEQQMLADNCFIMQRGKEEVIIEQDEVGDTLYIIIKGRVLILLKNQSTGWVRVNILHPGDVFGEIAILRHIPRTARVVTDTPCTFLTIDAKHFLEIYQYFPPKSRDNIQLIVEKRLASLADYASKG